MRNEDQLGDFYLASRLQGQDWLLPTARLARNTGYELTVQDAQMGGPMIRVTELETKKWLELPLDENTELEDVENLIREFPDVYSQMVPIEGDEDNHNFAGEGLPCEIVDVLLEAVDPDEFMQGFSRAEERPGGRPLAQVPTGKKILRAVELRTGHKLYVWRTGERREHYAGPASFYLGYRFVSPNGQIIFEGSGFHPGGGFNGEVSDKSLLMLVQGLCLDRNDIDDEELSKLTPEQVDWMDSSDCGRLSMDVAGYDDFGQDDPVPWKDLPGFGHTSQAA